MERIEKKDFYTSNERFLDWKKENCSSSICYFQSIDLKEGVQIEKWKLFYSDKIPEYDLFLVEIYANGNGFQLYKMFDPFMS